MVSVDYTLGIQIINFLLLIFILNMLLYKPILRILDSRKERIMKSEEEVKNVNQTIEQRVAEYEEKIRLAKMEAMGQRNEIQREGAEQGKEIIESAKLEIQKMIDDFQAGLDQEVSRAKEVLKGQSARISMEIAEKVLGRRLQ